MDKLDKKCRKIDRQVARLQVELAKLEQAAAKRCTARRGLPDVLPNWEQSEQSGALLNIDGFVRLRDPSRFEQISRAIHADTSAKIFALLSGVFDCDKLEICLIEDRIITRKGRKTPVVYFWYIYNQAFNEALKATGRATFSATVKTWNVEMDDDAKSAIAQRIGAFFRVVIDLGSMAVLRNEADPCLATQTRVAFGKLPFHVKIKRSDVIAAILFSRPFDSIQESSLCVNDGAGFVGYPGQDAIWTQCPFLLFRYTVADGRPRYVSLSTLGMTVEQVSYGNDHKNTSKAIARFMDACHTLRLPAFDLDCANAIAENHDLRCHLQGGFDRFKKSIERIQSVVSDLSFAPLCSDYVTLLSRNHGADSGPANIIAYVTPGAAEGHYLYKISGYFGYSKSDYPVVFTRAALDKWNEQEDCHFLLVAAHELAHWLVLDENEGFLDEDAHGLAWAVCQDLLEYLFVGAYTHTAYRQYHSDDQKMIENIECAISCVGIPEIESIKSYRDLCKRDVKNTVRRCLASVAGRQNSTTGGSPDGRAI